MRIRLDFKESVVHLAQPASFNLGKGGIVGQRQVPVDDFSRGWKNAFNNHCSF